MTKVLLWDVKHKREGRKEREPWGKRWLNIKKMPNCIFVHPYPWRAFKRLLQRVGITRVPPSSSHQLQMSSFSDGKADKWIYKQHAYEEPERRWFAWDLILVGFFLFSAPGTYTQEGDKIADLLNRVQSKFINIK